MPHLFGLGLMNSGIVLVAFGQNSIRNDQVFTRKSGNGTNRGESDDTALNDLEFMWCKI